MALIFIAAAAYYVVSRSTITSSSSTQSSTQTFTTPTVIHSTTTHLSTQTSPNSATVTTTTGSIGLEMFNGTFSFNLPSIPSGTHSYPNGTTHYYNSTQTGSGKFAFFINPANYSGTGTGSGTLTVTTRGFCTGQTSFPYAFKLTTSNILGNITIFVENPTPVNFTVSLTCTATPEFPTANSWGYLAIYPNEINIASAPVTITKQLTGDISYQITITPTN